MTSSSETKTTSSALYTESDRDDSAGINNAYNNINNMDPYVNFHNRVRRRLLSSPEFGAQLRSDLDALQENGYVILRNTLSAAELLQLQSESSRLLSALPYLGRNQFEGERTKRVYSIVAKSRAYDFLILRERILNVCKFHLMPNFLLSVSQLIEIFPGEREQQLHRDSNTFKYAHVPRTKMNMNMTKGKRMDGRNDCSNNNDDDDEYNHVWRLSTVWALDDFTEDNGSTVVLPKSHLWTDQMFVDNVRSQSKSSNGVGIQALKRKVIMNAGDCVLFVGNLWHGGGQNTSTHSRKAITIQYNQPWLRPQENDLLSVPLDMVKTLPLEIKKMIGYSMHIAIGNVEGRHPSKVIDERLQRYSKL